jgi:hypothetical protein
VRTPSFEVRGVMPPAGEVVEVEVAVDALGNRAWKASEVKYLRRSVAATRFHAVIDGDPDAIGEYGLADEGSKWRWPVDHGLATRALAASKRRHDERLKRMDDEVAHQETAVELPKPSTQTPSQQTPATTERAVALTQPPAAMEPPGAAGVAMEVATEAAAQPDDAASEPTVELAEARVAAAAPASKRKAPGAPRTTSGAGMARGRARGVNRTGRGRGRPSELPTALIGADNPAASAEAADAFAAIRRGSLSHDVPSRKRVTPSAPTAPVQAPRAVTTASIATLPAGKRKAAPPRTEWDLLQPRKKAGARSWDARAGGWRHETNDDLHEELVEAAETEAQEVCMPARVARVARQMPRAHSARACGWARRRRHGGEPRRGRADK